MSAHTKKIQDKSEKSAGCLKLFKLHKCSQ